MRAAMSGEAALVYPWIPRGSGTRDLNSVTAFKKNTVASATKTCDSSRESRARSAFAQGVIKATRRVRYIAVAGCHGFRLEYALDTHAHADHRSGTFDLADLTDAKVVAVRRNHRRAVHPPG
jgi:hypothetical protein